MTTVRRYDAASPLEKGAPLPGGGLAFAAYVTRTGVASYKLADGSTRRELRPPEEVFHPDSLASLRSAPVTDDHPPPGVEVTPENWKTYSIGTIGADVAPDGSQTHVAAPVLVQDGGALKRVDSGALKEASGGYNCSLEMTPGVFEGQPFDAIQRGIRYNHVALGPSGWGRLGPTVALRLDSNDAAGLAEGAAPRADSNNEQRDTTDPKGNAMSLKLDGKDATQADLDALKKDLDATRGRADAQAVQLTEVTAKLDAASKELALATSPANLQAAVKARVLIERGYAAAYKSRKDEKAAKLDEEAIGGSTSEALVLAALKLAIPDFNPAGKSPEYLAGAFEASVLPMLGGSAASEPEKPAAAPDANAVSTTPPMAAPAGDSILHVRGGPPNAQTATTDAADRSPDAARAHMVARNRAMAEGKRS